MKYYILILTITILTSFSNKSKVYVCMSKTSVAYHSTKTCNGLNSCSHEIKSLSIQEAENYGKRPCKKCY
jgi:hypothetical protein